MNVEKTGKKTAIILAGGQGTRMNMTMQKQYLQLEGKPLLWYSLEVFEKSSVDEVILVVGAEEIEKVQREILSEFQLKKVTQVAAGGTERFHSVYNGIHAIGTCDIVLIHDGARPFVTVDMIERVIDEAGKHGACVVGMPVKDTVKIVDQEGFAGETLDRRCLWQVQTPQAFSFPLAKLAYEQLMLEPDFWDGITDDAMVVERYTGRSAKLIMGSYENLKVTTQEDFIMAGALLKKRLEKIEKTCCKSE